MSDRGPNTGLTGPVSHRSDLEPAPYIKRLEALMPYIPEPTIAKPALEWILAQDRPAMAREIAEAIGARHTSVTQPLQRLAEKGLVQRRRQLMTFPHNCRPGETIQRLIWLYAKPEDEA